MQRIKETMTWLNTETAAITRTIHENGEMYLHTFTADNNTNNVTFTLEILDDDDKSIYSLAAIAENTTTTTGSLSIPVMKGFSVKATPSGDPGASGAVITAKIYIKTNV